MLRTVAHLDCFQDALVRGRHPLATARDLASLVVAGACTHDGLRGAWARVARDIERDTPPAVSWNLGKVPVLEDPDALLGLSLPQLKVVANAFGLKSGLRMSEMTLQIRAAHDANARRLRRPLSVSHVDFLDWMGRYSMTPERAAHSWGVRCCGNRRARDVILASDALGVPWKPKYAHDPNIVDRTFIVRLPEPLGRRKRTWHAVEQDFAVKRARDAAMARGVNATQRHALMRHPQYADLKDVIARIDVDEPACPECGWVPPSPWNPVWSIAEHVRRMSRR